MARHAGDLEQSLARFAGGYDDPSKCWTWIGCTNEGGYGLVTFNRKTYIAHKLVYEQRIAPVPKGFELHHTCRNKKCVNPAHLELTTRLIHKFDHVKQFCVRGHELSGDNVYIRPDTRERVCRACDRARR